MEEINVTQLIIDTINNIFHNFFSSIDNSLYSTLDDLIFITEDIMNDRYFEKTFGTTTSSGFLLIANSFLIGFVIFYAFSNIISHITLSYHESPIKFVFKIIILGILLNSSFFICEQIIFINSSFSLAIREIGENLFDKKICFSTLIQELNNYVYLENNNLNIFSFSGILKGFISFGLFNLVFSYALRYVMIKVFILLCPICILCLASEKTIWVFKSWLRCFLSLLFMQLLVSAILLVTFSLDFSNTDLFSNLLYVGTVFALTRVNSYIKDFMGGISTEIQTQISNFKQ